MFKRKNDETWDGELPKPVKPPLTQQQKDQRIGIALLAGGWITICAVLIIWLGYGGILLTAIMTGIIAVIVGFLFLAD